MRAVRPLALAGALLVAGCGGGDDERAAEGAEDQAVPYLPAPSPGRPLPPMADDFPELASKDCVDVVRFYLAAINRGEFDKAALVWNDPVIDDVRLRALFSGYREPLFEWTEPFVDHAAGSRSCTVGGTLIDASDPRKPVMQGTLVLHRIDDVPGATPAQLRWTLRSSTFVEEMRRSEG